jgi:hypothetical protein
MVTPPPRVVGIVTVKGVLGVGVVVQADPPASWKPLKRNWPSPSRMNDWMRRQSGAAMVCS